MLLALISFGPVRLLQAQSASGTILGTVTDASGAAIPQASITVTNVRTGITNSARTNASGDYVAPLLPPGVYSVRAEAPAFKTTIQEGLTLEVEQKLRADLSLEVGGASEKVTVTADATLVNTETAELGQVVTQRSITELPLNGRNFLQLVQLVPGANGGPPGTVSGGPSLNGASMESTGYLLDGSENTELFQHHASAQPSIDVIQEFKVQDKLMSAEFGTTSSGIVSAVTKSGTNDLHGGAWEFLRNNVLDARSFFDSFVPILRRNQYGGFLGGPVFFPKYYNGRNRTFFMANYEGIKVRAAGTAFYTVPTAAMKRGDFSAQVPSGQLFDPFSVTAAGQRTPFAGNLIPSTRFSPVSAKLLALFPDANRPSTAADPTRIANNFIKPSSSRTDSDLILARVDHQFSTGNRIFARYSSTRSTSISPGLISLGNAQSEVDGYNIALNHTWIITPSSINEVHLTAVRRRQFSGPASLLSLSDFNETYGFESRQPGVPPLTLTGMSGITAGSPVQVQEYPYTAYNAGETFSRVSGRHSFKFGAATERIGMNIRLANVGGGTRTFTGNFTRQAGAATNSLEGRSFADFLLGTTEMINGLNIDLGADRNRLRYAYYHAFVQDDWKVSRNLTLNLGLRYDYYQPPVTTNGRTASYFDFQTGAVVYPRNAPLPADCCAWRTAKSDTDQLYSGSRNNLAPRFGFAYRLGGNRTVIRGGYGIFFDPGLLNVGFNSSQTPPFFKNTTVTASPDETRPANFLFIEKDIAPANIALPLPVGFKAYLANEKTGMMQQWVLTAEHQFTSNVVAAGSYVGWKSDHFIVDNSANLPPPGAGNSQLRRPYQDFSSLIIQMDNASSNYQGFNAKLEQKLSHGLSYLAAYTWGHSIGNTPTENGATGENFLQRSDNLRLERANNAFDSRQRFVFSGVYEVHAGRQLSRVAQALLPGWQIGGIYSIQSGFPFTIFSNDVLNRGARTSNYASSNGQDPNLPADQRTVRRWFNTAAFFQPAAFTYGNLGRNTMRTRSVNNLDLSISRNFRFNERKLIQFRAEAFNAANRPQFGLPVNNVSLATFGQVTSTFNSGRQIQLGLKFMF